ncbi:MAG: LPS export ABC transporter periplasmic protein LptC [Pseudomonadales bacterium]|nr:LPS export ABC transporter periplasmic protein LptC [Pseudomonadales bacterium]
MTSKTIGMVILAIMAAYFYWATQESQTADRDDPEDEHTKSQPDVYGKGVRYHQLHPDGSLHYRLNAARIEQYYDREFTEMQAPRVHLLSANQPPWDIESKIGTIRQAVTRGGAKEDVVFLNEDVEMVQKHPENGTMTLRSEVFQLFPDRQYAQTDQDVIIDSEVGRTVAAGMVADLETGILTLSSDSTQRVHTIVLPEQFKDS